MKKRLELLIREGKSLSGSEKNVVFLNVADEGRRFVEVSAASGFDSPGDGRGMALGDWDQDGDLDVWLSNRTGPTISFYENQVGQESGYVAFDLEGTAPNCNRDAVGARVEVDIDGVLLIKGLRAGDGFRSQSSKRVHFGIGEAGEVGEVAVKWPGGKREIFEGVKAGGVYHLVQGSGKAVLRDFPKLMIQEIEMTKGEGPKPFARFVDRSPFPALPELGKGAVETGNIRLVVLWQQECESCRAELEELTDRKDELEELGVDVLALTADGGGRRKRAELFLAKIGYPFDSGYLEEDTVERILVLHRHLFYQPYHLVVPTSFLLDAEGRLSGVFRGELTWDELVYQAGVLKRGEKLKPLLAGTQYVSFDRSRPAILIKDYLSEGIADEAERIFRMDRKHKTLESQADDILRTIGEVYLVKKDFESAERLFLEALEVGGENARVLNQLGAARFAVGDVSGAMDYWRRACKADPLASEPLINLGKNLLREKKTEEAMDYLRRYQELKPSDADGYNYLAMGYLRNGEFSKAQEHLGKLIELRPEDGVAYLNLAKVHLRYRDRAAAKKALDKGMSQKGVSIEQYGQLKAMRDQLGD